MFGNFSLFNTPFPGLSSVPPSVVSFFCLIYFSLPLFEDMGCFSGCLMSSAGIQKLFCGIYLAFKCSFDEFVGEKVFSPSYSSAKLAPPPNRALFDLWWEFQHSSRVETGIWGNFWSFVKRVKDPLEFQGKRGLSLEMLQCKRASSSVQVRILLFAWSCGGKLRVPLELPVDLRDRSCFLREVRAPLAFQGPHQDSSPFAAGMNRASSQDEG